MDLSETLVKERFDTALTGVTPDVTDLVRRSTERGRVLRRRRRLQTGLGAAAASVLAVTAITYAVGTGPFDSDATGPADGTLSQEISESSTPRGLAAAVMTHLDVAPFAVGGEKAAAGEETGDAGSLYADLGYSIDGTKVELMAVATPNFDQWSQMRCGADSDGLKCRSFRLADGSPAIVGLLSESGDGAGDHLGYVVVAVKRADQIVAVVETTRSAYAIDPASPTTQWDLPVDVAALTQIAADPMVGLETSADLNAAGEQIEDWTDGMLTTGESSIGSSASVAPPEPAATTKPGSDD